jgi:transposase-like protein
VTAGYTFALDCPRCGSQLEHRTNGTSTGLSTRAVAHCPRCNDDWLIEVTIRSEKKTRGIEQGLDELIAIRSAENHASSTSAPQNESRMVNA